MEPSSCHGAARAYQLEMLEHSLKHNVILAVGMPKFNQFSTWFIDYRNRWTQAVAKQWCSFHFALMPRQNLMTVSAILRIRAQLESLSGAKVGVIMKEKV